MKKTFPILITVAAAYLLQVCSNSPTRSDPNPPSQFTKHELEWFSDTLTAPNAFQITIQSIWGANENDVWAVGHADISTNSIWRWDSTQWNRHPIGFPGHPYDPAAVYGFSENDVWCVGAELSSNFQKPDISYITHFDGAQWQLTTDIVGPECFSVWGSSSQNLFVGCDSGIVLHYNGSNWVRQSVNNSNSVILSILGVETSEVYAIGQHIDFVQPHDSSFFYFYKYSEGNWTTADSGIQTITARRPPFGTWLWAAKDGTLYSANAGGFYKYDNAIWERIPVYESLRAIGGTDWNDIYIGGFNHQLHHFNGEDWFTYSQFVDPSRFILAITAFENSVFVSSTSGFNTILYRGYRNMEQKSDANSVNMPTNQ